VAMSTPTSSDPREWFAKDELAVCPFCGESAVPRQADDEVFVCLACKAIWRLEKDQAQRLG
jgi:ribosomal protein L37AE/L43A